MSFNVVPIKHTAPEPGSASRPVRLITMAIPSQDQKYTLPRGKRVDYNPETRKPPRTNRRLHLTIQPKAEVVMSYLNYALFRTIMPLASSWRS